MLFILLGDSGTAGGKQEVSSLNRYHHKFIGMMYLLPGNNYTKDVKCISVKIKPINYLLGCRGAPSQYVQVSTFCC